MTAPHRILKDNLSAKHCKHPLCLSVVLSMSVCVFLNITSQNIPSIPSPYNCVSESLFLKKNKKIKKSPVSAPPDVKRQRF